MKKCIFLIASLLLLGAGCQTLPTTTPRTESVKLFFVALSDNGASGKKIGCGDSLVGVAKAFTSPTTDPLADTLDALFEEKDRYYGQSGLYNSLVDSNLEIKRISSVNGVYTVELTGMIGLGGSCDSPRLYNQIMETILEVPGVQKATVLINNKKLEDAVSTK